MRMPKGVLQTDGGSGQDVLLRPLRRNADSLRDLEPRRIWRVAFEGRKHPGGKARPILFKNGRLAWIPADQSSGFLLHGIRGQLSSSARLRAISDDTNQGGLRCFHISPCLTFLAVFVLPAMAIHYRGRVRFGFLRQMTDPSTCFAQYNVLMYLFSAVPTTNYLSLRDCPEIGLLTRNWTIIRAEALRLFYEGFPGSDFHQWDIQQEGKEENQKMRITIPELIMRSNQQEMEIYN